MTSHLHENDLPDGLNLGNLVAIDTETMGLNLHRDRLCLIQLSSGNGVSHLVKISKNFSNAPNLKRLFINSQVLKLFHYGRFDIAVLLNHFGVLTSPVYCTKIASRLVRTFTDKHGLKNILNELLDIDLSKQQQSSDWGNDVLSPEQIDYAANDVLYLHKAKSELDIRLKRENREKIAQACFEFFPHRASLDLLGWADQDIFSHS